MKQTRNKDNQQRENKGDTIVCCYSETWKTETENS